MLDLCIILCLERRQDSVTTGMRLRKPSNFLERKGTTNSIRLTIQSFNARFSNMRSMTDNMTTVRRRQHRGGLDSGRGHDEPLHGRWSQPLWSVAIGTL